MQTEILKLNCLYFHDDDSAVLNAKKLEQSKNRTESKIPEHWRSRPFILLPEWSTFSIPRKRE